MKKVLFVVVILFITSLSTNAQSFGSVKEDNFFKLKKSPLSCEFTQNIKLDDKFSFVPDDENDTNKKRRKKRRRGSSSSGSMALEFQGGIFIPTGTMADGSGIGFGGLTSFYFPVSDEFHLGLGTGYYAFSGKTFSMEIMPGFSMEGTGPAIGMIPILLHGRYFFSTESFAPYGGLSTGLYIFAGDVTGTNFGLTPKLGFLLGENSLKFNTEVGYGMVFTEGNTSSFLEIKLGLNISF